MDTLKVKIALLKKGLTQTELAKNLGVSRQRISNVITGAVRSKSLEKRIYEYLDIKEKN